MPPPLDPTFTSDGNDRQLIHCIYCRAAQQISHRALTITCKFCNKVLKIESLTIQEYQARRTIETCGSLTIEKKGNVFSDRILCGSLVVRGRVKANIVSYGPVLIAPQAQIKGDITAPTIAVGDGAILEGHCRIGG